jgi:CheY-like chemotaxis protein
MIARIALERAGYRCTIVDDGEKALSELSSGRYDVALIDMHMPQMDGLELARLYNFASFDAPARTPIIMLTADNRPEAVADADLAGIARFLVKPIKPSALLRVVHDVLDAAVVAPNAMPAAVVAMGGREVDPPDLDPSIFSELQTYMDPSEARQFFAEFRHDARAYIATVRQVCEPDFPCKKLRDDMHALCGAARTIGALRLAAIARRIEYASEAELHEASEIHVEQLNAALNSAMRLVEQRLIAAA